MEQALIICDAPKGREFYEEILTKNGFEHIVVANDGEEGRRALIEGDFEVCIINAPLKNTNPIPLAKDIAMKNSCQVLLVVREEIFESTAEAVEDFGVMTLSKPIHRQAFWSALKLTKASAARMAIANSEIKRLQKALDEQKAIARAKCLLIEHKHLSEQEAHRFLEKQAMDRRVSRQLIAEDVISFYSEE
ncbi:MAG: ANTAR domain-containing protein [Lachnospiraceae bacterium]|nr:ANTAR domain-containing protein [Lachnospiraceae bacterium]